MNHNKNYIRETYPEMLEDRYQDYGEGWVPHINKITDTLVDRVNTYNNDNSVDLKLQIQQIKQKFGGLRYYFAIENNDVSDIDFVNSINEYVRRMESVCGFICEVCGKYAETVTIDGLISTLCDGHYELTKKEVDNG